MTTRLDEWQTARLRLTRMVPEDLDELVRMYQDERVMATLAGVRTPEQTRARLALHMADWERDGFGWWTMRDRETGAFVGRGGLRAVTVLGQPEVEVGYGLRAEWWGRGLATELACESVRVGFEVLGLPALVCYTLPTNLASRRVMEKAGFRYVGDFVHADLPHVLHRLTADAWRSARPDR